jgi:hypothetical protein
MFPETEEEGDAAELVKRDKTILVVLGNPPGNTFAGVSPEGACSSPGSSLSRLRAAVQPYP